MTSPVLFSTGSAPTSAASRNLVEFKAGKMEMRDKMVHSIKRKGLVFLHQSPDDNLMHFCWKDRQTGSVEDDLILFPDDCEFKRVKECTTGRVYVLKMKSSNKKMFFWMQEPKEDRDDDFCLKINEMLNNPPQAGSDIGGTANSERDLQAIFGGMTQEQMATFLNSSGLNQVNLASILTQASLAQGRSPSTNSARSNPNSSAPTSATSGGSSATNAAGATANANDFRSLISGSVMEGNEDDSDAVMAAALEASQNMSQGGGGAGGNSSVQQPMIDLSTAINSDSLAELLNDEQFLKVIEPHLPPVSLQEASSTTDQRNAESAKSIRSSQFKSSLSQFCAALQSGQLGPLMSQFGLNQACVDAASLGNLEAFVRALESQFKGQDSTGNTADGSNLSSQQPKE